MPHRITSRSKSTATEVFENLPVEEQVRRAFPHARALLIGGINIGDHGDEDIVETVAKVIGDPTVGMDADGDGLSDKALSKLSSQLGGARALGIALGLMLRPETFLTKGGAR